LDKKITIKLKTTLNGFLILYHSFNELEEKVLTELSFRIIKK